MSDQKLPRLLAAAKEFNIGQDTLVEFLAGKGFPKDDLKPTAKLTPEMYLALQKEFQSDKVAKAKSDMIDLPKGASPEAKKKKEDEEIHFKKEEKKGPEKEVISEVSAHEPAVVAVEPPKEEVKPAAPVEEEVAHPHVEKVEEASQPEQAETTVRLDAPEIDMPKVVGVIDLSAIDSSTRPKKGAKKPAPAAKKETEEQAPEPVAAVPSEPAQPAEPAVAAEAEQENGTEEKVIENIQTQRLSGPKIIGKIELPVER
ncbi:MAG TPA: hypothetical protein VLL95_05760, partial [Phnomibacter sp.]|nr:hypothetical protein [Phnomibacter sp.]